MVHQVTEQVYQVMERILEDMLQPAAYIPYGIGAGGLFLLGWLFIYACSFGTKRQKKGRGPWRLFFCVVYLTVLLILAFFSREPGSRTGIDWELFATWGKSAQSHAYFIENILMFVPFGLLLPAAVPAMRSGIICVGSGFFLSAGLELAQLLTGRGFCQLDDIVTNTAGCAAGYLFFLIWHRFCKKQEN